ncbi:4-hydroxy-3-polyprenylbenzoate decarboxylase [Carboxydocella sporoproducens DSM 16521]|uniref:4-hydroxy-3-polyprenylbenzoate decarboxylase n=2 Tax=Carboxydocella TaxID=178898 RepID=A0A1T4PWE8_9FIRM|nr:MULTISPECIES: menaquinone biosynthesis decarboxylase [Carboxydocella]AVX20457.1 4-hydroxy-3-polyprenylbenzoate decarboxylase [Carboxydocella thermautotrophica]SJZ95627.1 4-hydroxy-3-polyprenylbenzoate decarboxylase [Carboxydocella sporoproducens DSM 16521]
MGYRDLRHFIEALEQKGWLKRITTEVDPILEITEITDRVSKAYGPALLFENVKGSDMPVLINAFGTFERMNLALEVNNLDEIGQEILTFLQPPEVPTSFFDKLKALPKVAQIANFMPKIVKTGPVKEVILKGDEIDITKFPILKCWPGDGGRFITLPLVFTKDPETGKRNVGMYRMQVYDGRTTGMHWHLHKHGAEHYRAHKRRGDRKMEVAVALGADPATIYAATAPLPAGVDEMFFAGFLRKEPVELVKCETVDLEVPALAEIVLEGYVDLDELRWEGPFGDHTGYYSLADYYPVFHINCVTMRKKPIYPTTIVGKPPMEDCYLGKATERIFLPLLKLQLPEIVDMNLPLEGVFHNCAIVSIRKSYPGHAKKVMHALWGMGQMMFTKLIIVVDEHVNPHNVSEVMWKVFNNIDAKRDVVMVEGPLDILDHASPLPNYGTKMGIDATKKWPSEGHTREWPDDIEMSPEIKELVDRKWKSYGID